MSGRRKTTFLVAATVLPVFLLAALLLHQTLGIDRHEAEARLARAANTLALEVDRIIAEESAALTVLAACPELDTGNVEQFHRLAIRTEATRRNWLNVVLADRSRQLVNTRLPYGAELPPLRSTVEATRVFESGRVTLSALERMPERLTQPFVSLNAPVMREGTVRYVLVATMPAWTFHRLLAGKTELAPGGRAMLIDQHGRMVATSDSTDPSDTRVGAPISASLLSDAAENLRGPDGERMVTALATAPLAGWRVALVQPAAALESPLTAGHLLLLASGLLALGLSVLVASVLVRQLRRVEALKSERVADRALAGVAAHIPGLIHRHSLRPDGTITVSGLAGALGPPPDTLFPRQPAGTPPATAGSSTRTPPALKPPVEAALRASAPTLAPVSVEHEGRTAEGGTRWLRTVATPHRAPDGAVVWDGLTVDITDLHRTEAALRENESRLRMAQEAAGLGSWDWDLAGGRILWSDGFFRILGVRPGTVRPDLVTYIERFVHPDDRQILLAKAQHASLRGGVLSAEYRIIREDGSVRWLECTGSSVDGPDGRPVRLLGIIRDTTERKTMEEALQAALEEAQSANATKARFFAAASHDLRQPVQTLFLFAHALSERLRDHPVQPLVATIQQALEGLKALIDTLLDIARLDSGTLSAEPADFPAVTLMQRLAADYAPRMAAKGLRFRLAGSPVWIRSDSVLLGRILGNLLDNALKYTDHGGVLLSCRRRGDHVRIEVWDTGPGIAPEHHDAVFEEFVQLGPTGLDHNRGPGKGLGLGLSIVRRLATLLGHELMLRSRPGRGTVFSVMVPLAADGSVSLPPPPLLVAAGTDGPPLAVMLDDDATILTALGMMLEEWGFETISAATPEEALERIAQRRRRPDVIIADYHLPGNGTGIEAIRRIRTYCNAPVPSVVLTGDTGAERALEVGRIGSHLLRKPVPPDTLHDLIHRLAGVPKNGAS
ncbi:ATP-binding protein [Azospirillum sp. sgz302134]